MHKWLATLFFVFAGMASEDTRAESLEDFNMSHPWDGAAAEVSDDPNLVSQFKDKDFVCRDPLPFIPKENDIAIRSFNEFVGYSIAGDKIENFWMDAVHREKRESLLATAVQAGSWKAEYLDIVWTMRYPKNAEAKTNAFPRLVKLVERGIPIAAYRYASYLFPRGGKDMYYLFDAAIDRGNPQAMTWVGTTIIVQSKDLRPIGRALLECAAHHNHAPAYKGLGILADMEGRRLDAYRFWEKGVNEGCEECIPYMMNIAKAQYDSPNKSLEDSMPKLASIKKFYDEDMFYGLSGLSEFERRLPTELIFHPTDAALLRVLKSEREARSR